MRNDHPPAERLIVNPQRILADRASGGPRRHRLAELERILSGPAGIHLGEGPPADLSSPPALPIAQLRELERRH